ncbi:c-type cytochrome [Gynuella sp.]|uniref:c-type cytochrome n=1 Tax=Gynuella sp. TaxID=2969146 RepID=UPI003D09900C
MSANPADRESGSTGNIDTVTTDTASYIEADLRSGESLYQSMCAGCHGNKGTGGVGGPLLGCQNCSSYKKLTQVINDTMPIASVSACTGTCAEDVAGYIMNNFSTQTADSSTQKLEYTILTLPETLRRFSTTVINRRPTDAEYALAETEAGFDQVVREMMTEFEFGVWLKTTFNDLLFTNKYVGNASSMINYSNYSSTSGLENTSSPYLERNIYFDTRCYTKLVNWSFSQEPLELIRYIAMNDLDIEQILTANYRMVNYYTQRDKIHGRKLDGSLFTGDDFKYVKYDGETTKSFFCNEYKYTDENLASSGREPASGDNLYFYDFNDFQPAILPKKINGATSKNPPLLTYQVDETDPLPMAGVLTSEMFLERYPTNSGNRNRLRASKVLKFFLDIDIGASQVDAIESEGFDNPIMEDPNCTACHVVMDPIASSFRHWLNDGTYWPDREHFSYSSIYHERTQEQQVYDSNFWNYEGMLPAGFNIDGIAQDAPEGVDPLQWMAKQVVAQKRYYTSAIIRTLYNGLLGEYDNPEYFRSIYDQFSASGVETNYINDLVLALIKLDDYRINGITQSGEGEGEGEDEVRSIRLLTPEMLARKIYSSTNLNWAVLKNSSVQVLYGGIDSDAYTTRLTNINGVSEAFSERMAAEMACQSVTNDFRKDVQDRVLFPDVLITDQPESEAEIAKIKNNIVYLHDWLVGETLSVDSDEINETYDLFLTAYEYYRDAGNSSLDSECQAIVNREYEKQRGQYRIWLEPSRQIKNDTFYTIKPWMAVMNYLLLDAKFLHD